MQSDQTGRAGHFIVTFLLVQGAKADPNLKTTGARVYRLVTRDSLEDEYRRQEEAKAKLVPLAADPRPEAKQLLAELCSSCRACCVQRCLADVHPRQGFSVPDKALTADASTPTPTPATPAPGNPAAGTAVATTAETKNNKAAAAKGKAKAKANPKATWDVKKAKLSTLDSAPFPLVDRPETKKVLEGAVLAKAGVLTLSGCCRVPFFPHMCAPVRQELTQSCWCNSRDTQLRSGLWMTSPKPRMLWKRHMRIFTQFNCFPELRVGL